MSTTPQHGPFLLEVKGHSLDDGPGIRSVVFFKGCALACAWCHNPEAKEMASELSFDAERCCGTLACLPVCEPHALDRNRPGFVDRERCTLCGRCVEVCPSEAFEIVGRAFDIDAIIASVTRYEPFFRNSGGGVTLSGGEPLLFLETAAEVLRRLRERGIHTLVETCGTFSLDRYTALVEPFIDQLYFDLKLHDDAAHRQWCGTSNRTILENFRELQRRSREGGVPMLPRIPLVPDVTATAGNLSALAAFLHDSAVERVALLPYNPLWSGKTAKLGRTVRYPRTTWMSPEEIEWCRSFFDGFALVNGSGAPSSPRP